MLRTLRAPRALHSKAAAPGGTSPPGGTAQGPQAVLLPAGAQVRRGGLNVEEHGERTVRKNILSQMEGGFCGTVLLRVVPALEPAALNKQQLGWTR